MDNALRNELKVMKKRIAEIEAMHPDHQDIKPGPTSTDNYAYTGDGIKSKPSPMGSKRTKIKLAAEKLRRSLAK